MHIKIGVSLSIMAQYVQRRGETYQFYIRVPVHLHGHYGKTRIRQSLNTKDERDAMREGEKLARKYHAEFKALSQGVKMTPADTALAGKHWRNCSGQVISDTTISSFSAILRS